MKDYTEYTDEELVDLLRQGETEVMDYLLEKYKFIVRQKARVLYLAGGEADDLIQDFLRLSGITAGIKRLLFIRLLSYVWTDRCIMPFSRRQDRNISH